MLIYVAAPPKGGEIHMTVALNMQVHCVHDLRGARAHIHTDTCTHSLILPFSHSHRVRPLEDSRVKKEDGEDKDNNTMDESH